MTPLILMLTFDRRRKLFTGERFELGLWIGLGLDVSSTTLTLIKRIKRVY